MGASVAGQIRIDLLANVAQFKAGMREAGREGLGSFQEQVEKFDRWFDSRKSMASRTAKEGDSWVRAMRGDGGPLQNVGGMWGGMTPDLALRREMRLRDQLPFGQSTWSTLSSADAARAAAIADPKQSLAKSFSSLGGHVGGMLGGGLGGTIGSAIFSPATLGIGASVAVVAELTHEFKKCAEEARRTVLEADKIGLSVEGFDTLKRAAELTGTGVDAVTGSIQKMNKAIGLAASGDKDKQKGFAQLGLDANKLMGESPDQAFESIAKSVAKIGNQFERARIEAEIFGRGGMELDAVLRKTATDAEKIRAGELTEQDQQALASFGAGWESLKHKAGIAVKSVFADFAYDLEATIGMETRLTPPIDAATEAMKRSAEAAMQYKENLKEALTPLESLRDKAHEMAVGSDRAARGKFIEGLDAKGIKGFDRDGAIADYDKAQADIKATEKSKADKADRDRLRKEGITPEGKLAASNAESERLFGGTKFTASEAREWKALHAGQLTDEETLAQLKRRHLEEYYREAAGLDAKHLAKEMQSPWEKYQEEKKWRQKAQADGILTPDLAGRAGAKADRDLKNALGISDPLGDYQKSLGDLDQAYQSGGSGITKDQYEKRRQQLRDQAISGMAGDNQELHPTAAMAAGSREAHSLAVQNMLSDPKLKVAQETLAALKRIEKDIAATAGHAERTAKAMQD
jgi:hypothetical protein